MCLFTSILVCVGVWGGGAGMGRGKHIFFQAHSIRGEAGGGGPPPFFLATNKFIKLQIFSSFF